MEIPANLANVAKIDNIWGAMTMIGGFITSFATVLIMNTTDTKHKYMIGCTSIGGLFIVFFALAAKAICFN